MHIDGTASSSAAPCPSNHVWLTSECLQKCTDVQGSESAVPSVFALLLTLMAESSHSSFSCMSLTAARMRFTALSSDYCCDVDTFIEINSGVTCAKCIFHCFQTRGVNMGRLIRSLFHWHLFSIVPLRFLPVAKCDSFLALLQLSPLGRSVKMVISWISQLPEFDPLIDLLSAALRSSVPVHGQMHFSDSRVSETDYRHSESLCRALA